MAEILQPSFIHGHAMLLAGVRQYHAYAHAATDIPQQWAEFKQQYADSYPETDASYGVICASDTQGFEYMCAVEVASFEHVPATLGRLKIQPQYYAVFTHTGAIADIKYTWEAILHNWLPHSGWQAAQAPNFERYDQRFDSAKGAGAVEIWLALAALIEP